MTGLWDRACDKVCVTKVCDEVRDYKVRDKVCGMLCDKVCGRLQGV